MLANFTLTQCFNLCLQDFTQGISLMQIWKDSSPVGTNLEVLKIWSCFFQQTKTDCRNESFSHNVNPDKGWLCQCRWVLWSLQHSVWSNGLFLSSLFVSRGTTCLNWRRHSTLSKKEGKGWNAETVHEEKCYTVVQMWKCECWNLNNTDVSVKAHLIESLPYKHALRQNQLLDKIRSGALFGYVQCDIKVQEHLWKKIASFPTILKNTHACKQDIGPLRQEGVCWKEGFNFPIAENPNFLLWANQWHHHYSLATNLRKTGTRMQEILSLRWVHSCELFQQLCAIRCQDSSSRRRESQIQCYCRNFEVACKLLEWLSKYGSQLPFSYNVIEGWIHKCSDQQKNFQEIGAYQPSTLRGRAGQIWNRRKRTNLCRLLYLAVR